MPLVETGMATGDSNKNDSPVRQIAAGEYQSLLGKDIRVSGLENGTHRANKAWRGSMNKQTTTSASQTSGAAVEEQQGFVLGLWGVRYQVRDVSRSVAFYTQQLGFKLDMQNLPAFGQVSIDKLKLILSGPGASGSRPLGDGTVSYFMSLISPPGLKL